MSVPLAVRTGDRFADLGATGRYRGRVMLVVGLDQGRRCDEPDTWYAHIRAEDGYPHRSGVVLVASLLDPARYGRA